MSKIKANCKVKSAPRKKKKLPSQGENETKFFESLYVLCRKHKVNLTSDDMTIVKDLDSNSRDSAKYTWIEVTGGWNILPKYDAVVAVRCDELPEETTFYLKGIGNIND